ncbi:hypothetical protein NDI76_02020 [Halogeometricum sp. S1BR25-6]|uniref:DUF5602 domain-containing protein n=1 Tax=Halogeometricum salsisoli TaxID=2950536 RepID=A0ABU2G9R1_9EURY|nr:hypothetical protein [Halogeometricum sp. S1BR25-6]MDS0297517.1 hypothetical protein [Halogeometricum sp. S1BR25-6]
MNSDRRTFLHGLGVATAGSIALSSTTAAKRGGFPPSGTTAWGESYEIGEGEISTFSTVTPSGNPKYVGIHLSDGALADLPYADAFEDGEVEDGVQNHGFWSLPFDLDFPDDVPAPFEYAGLGWNPQGHTPKDVYTKPHFDVHFYFENRNTIGDIGINPETGEPYVIDAEDIADGQIPDGYSLLEGGLVVPTMGAHLAPTDAPELDDEEWLETLIWGVADVDGDDAYELNFIEPMVTVDYLENHLRGVVRDAVAQPDAYPQDGHYPTRYEIRDLGGGGDVIALTDFAERRA